MEQLILIIDVSCVYWNEGKKHPRGSKSSKGNEEEKEDSTVERVIKQIALFANSFSLLNPLYSFVAFGASFGKRSLSFFSLSLPLSLFSLSLIFGKKVSFSIQKEMTLFYQLPL